MYLYLGPQYILRTDREQHLRLFYYQSQGPVPMLWLKKIS